MRMQNTFGQLMGITDENNVYCSWRNASVFTLGDNARPNTPAVEPDDVNLEQLVNVGR